MNVISKAEAARKLGVSVEELGKHVYLRTYGGMVPERFWTHQAFTEEEFTGLEEDKFSFFRKIEG